MNIQLKTNGGCLQDVFIKVLRSKINRSSKIIDWVGEIGFEGGAFIKLGLQINSQSICANKSTLLYLLSNTSKPSSTMQDKYLRLMRTQNVQYLPTIAYDTARKTLVHLYHDVPLNPSTFKEEVNLYLSRKESFSGSVVTVNKITDQHIAISQGSPAMEVTVVTEYVPWRLHLSSQNITYEQALFLLEGSVKGFRQLLHKVKAPFLVESFMIGVDYKGEVKVWWNQHFHQNKFSFKLAGDVKLRDMVVSLISRITEKLDGKDRKILQSNLLCGFEVNFVNLEHRVRDLSKGLSLKTVGKNMVEAIPDVAMASQKVKQLIQPQFFPSQSQFRTSVVSGIEKSILILPESPTRRKLDPSEDKVITKRIYKDGTAPDLVQKMNVIKDDILKLREVANSSSIDASPTLRQSKSLSNFTSYFRGVNGNQQIPEVNRMIRQSRIVEFQKPTVSLFLQPSKLSMSNSMVNPEKCTICTGVQSVRKSQMSTSRADLNLSRIRSLQNLRSDRDFFETERSCNDFRMDASILKNRFGESQKKLPSSIYFASLLQ